jgi:hypothetical protein
MIVLLIKIRFYNIYCGLIILPQRAQRYYTKFTKSRLLTLTFRSGYGIKKAMGFSPEKQNPKIL